jgi:hypothetical protein
LIFFRLSWAFSPEVRGSTAHGFLEKHFRLLKKIASGRVAIAHAGPRDVADGRMVDTSDDWSENCALTSARRALWKRKKGRLA